MDGAFAFLVDVFYDREDFSYFRCHDEYPLRKTVLF
jgi:hypothetical protein